MCKSYFQNLENSWDLDFYHFYTVSALKTAKKVLKIFLRASRATNIYKILGNFEDVLLLFSKIWEFLKVCY